jgi:hypothetical protein
MLLREIQVETYAGSKADEAPRRFCLEGRWIQVAEESPSTSDSRWAQTMTFDYQPTLVGDLVTLRPLDAGDFDDLYAIAADPLIWEQHPAND